MGGKLDFESKLKEGSTFWFRVPLKILSPVVAVPTKNLCLKTSEILVVDDDPVNLTIMGHFLKKLNQNSTVVDSGEKALEAVKNKLFDLIIMDCQMPGMDGYKTTTEIRNFEKEKGYKIPILACTAHPEIYVRTKCLEVGMSDYMAKPVHLETLKSILEKWLVQEQKKAV